jgi:hypothetical protein
MTVFKNILSSVGSVLTGTQASRPAAGISGRVFYPIDGYYASIDNGSSWDTYINGFKCSNPPAANTLTAINTDQYTTLAADGDGLMMTQYGRGNGNEWNSWFVTPIASAPYKFVVGFDMMYFRTSAWNQVGLCLTNGNGSTPSAVTFGMGFGDFGYPSITCIKFNTPSSVSGLYNEAGYATMPYTHRMIFLRFRDDNTTRYFEISPDGRNWMTHYSTTRTDFITPTYCGVAIKQSVGSVTAGVLRTKAKIFHWYLGS